MANPFFSGPVPDDPVRFLAQKKTTHMNSTFMQALGFAGEDAPSLCKLCLFHPDYNRWSRNLTGVSSQQVLQGRGLVALLVREAELPPVRSFTSP